MSRPTKIILAAVLAFAGLAALGQQAHASTLKSRITDHNMTLVDLKQRDVDGVVAKEIKLAEMWLQEAQAELAKEEEEVVEFLLRRTEEQLELITALLDQHDMEKLAKEREKAATDMQHQANEEEIALEQAKLKKQNLEERLKQLTGQ